MGFCFLFVQRTPIKLGLGEMTAFLLRVLVCLAPFLGLVNGALEFESIQLKDKEVASFPGAAFSKGKPHPTKARCRAFPGTDDWPSVKEWRRLNASLEGALLNPEPPAIACYPGASYNAAQCSFLVNNASASHFYVDNPLTALATWPQGSTCLPGIDPVGNCTLGGYPSYVVNATTVKEIQLAVNFARNNNLRLVIK